MPVHKTHMHPQSLTLHWGRSMRLKRWLNYLMRCNKSWQDQLAQESGFSSFYHYVEMWTIVERNVTLLCCSFGTQLCSTVLKSSSCMECKAWWMLWKMLPVQSSLFLMLFLKFWKCFDLAGHSCVQHWDPCSTHWLSRAAALGNDPQIIPSLWPCLSPSPPLLHNTPGHPFLFLIPPSPQRHCWLIIATTSCSYLSIFF